MSWWLLTKWSLCLWICEHSPWTCCRDVHATEQGSTMLTLQGPSTSPSLFPGRNPQTFLPAFLPSGCSINPGPSTVHLHACPRTSPKTAQSTLSWLSRHLDPEPAPAIPSLACDPNLCQTLERLYSKDFSSSAFQCNPKPVFSRVSVVWAWQWNTEGKGGLS